MLRSCFFFKAKNIIVTLWRMVVDLNPELMDGSMLKSFVPDRKLLPHPKHYITILHTFVSILITPL